MGIRPETVLWIMVSLCACLYIVWNINIEPADYSQAQVRE